MQRNLTDLEGLYDGFITYCRYKISQDVNNDTSEHKGTDSNPFMAIERLVSNQ